DRPRSELSKFAPRIETIKIHPDKIREVIGPGGKMIRSIQSETGTAIELEDDGTVRITGAKADGRERAKAMIMGMTKEPEVGEVGDRGGGFRRGPGGGGGGGFRRGGPPRG